jgi:hypothetical protein
MGLFRLWLFPSIWFVGLSMTKPVKENQYTCESGCHELLDLELNSDFELLFEHRETYPDNIKDDMTIQLLSHTPMDDYKVYEVQGTLCLALSSITNTQA